MKLKFPIRQLSFLLVMALSGIAVYAQGPLRAMYFPGTGVLTPSPTATTNSYVDLGTALRDSFATSDFTIELWVKMGTTNSVNPVIIGDKDWASGSNTGFILSYYASTDASSGTAAANTLRFNFKPVSGTRVDYDIAFPLAVALRWNHIAITVNRSGNITGYLNGIATGQAYVAGAENISADVGKSIAGTWPVRLGTDGKPFGYRAPFNGIMDEVRIWKSVRTPQQIRDNMCRKLTGAESTLLAYYQMNELSGSSVVNNAVATSGSFNGTLANNTNRVGSGAPVGDASVNLYATSWAGQSLELATANRGIFTVDSFGTTGSYLHLYQVNAVPDSTSGLTAFADNNVYFGTFASGDTFRYYPQYQYSNYSTAQSYENTIGLFTRVFNADPLWVAKPNLYNNTVANKMRIDSVSGTHQFFLANFVSTCNTPSGLSAGNIQANSAELSWTTGGAALWNIEYGTAGFTLGSGTLLTGITSNPYTVNGLAGNTSYEFYVKDTCTGIGASNWAGPFSLTTLPDFGSFGSGYALNFNGSGVQNSPVQAVNLGGLLRDSLATTDFTIEMWVKIGETNTGNPPLIADKDYVSGGNTGICWTYTGSVLWGDAAAHVFRFNFKPAGGTRRDYDMIAPNEHTWNHLAITVDRRGFIKGYINGVYRPSLYSSGAGSVAADSGKTLAGTMPLYLGTDGTGNYRSPLNGNMDEVRVWNKVRTEEELRAGMCHKLNGAESGLLAYYRMDEPSGSLVTNSAAITTGTMNGTTVNALQRVISSAPIGDTSVYVYPAAGWNGVSLTMNTLNRGALTVDSITDATIPGVHIYTVNSVPNFQAGIAAIGTTDKYLGVFTANDPATACNVTYDYNNYANAVSNSTTLHLYNRPDNAVSLWSQLPANHNTTAHTFNRNAPLGVRQYLLADFTAAGCPAPYAITLDNADFSSASISWSSAAGTHQTRYGLTGFNLSTGTDTVVYVNNRDMNGLASNTGYDFYVRDSCSTGNTSPWTGPFYFTTANPCPQPDNVHADSITKTSLVVKWADNGVATIDYALSWGINGTFSDPAMGILQNTTQPRFALSGLQANTAYDFYVSTNCNANIANSGWAGPFTFTTDSVDAPVSIPSLAGDDPLLRLYPNPAHERVVLSFPDNNAAGITNVSVVDQLGICVYNHPVQHESCLELATAGWAGGMYHITCQSARGILHKTIVVRH